MSENKIEWPAEPWVVSGPGAPDPKEIGCIFQEGEVTPIAVVDKDRENPDDYVQATAQRICACVNAMAGIEDPESFVRRLHWRPISEAPKSLAEGSSIQGIYLLGFCPEEGADPKGCMEIIWWEPNEKSRSGKMGCWFGASAFEMHPTHWMPLPEPPNGRGV